MKNITKQAWFVPVVIGIIIAMVLVIFNYKDQWFAKGSGWNIKTITFEEADKNIDEGKLGSEDDFIIIFGSDSCAACEVYYDLATKGWKSSLTGYLPIRKTNRDKDDDYQYFWDKYVKGSNSYDWYNNLTGNEFGSSTETPISLIVIDGEIVSRISGAPQTISRMSQAVAYWKK